MKGSRTPFGLGISLKTTKKSNSLKWVITLEIRLWKENGFFSEHNANIHILKGPCVFRLKKMDNFMHSKSKQNKTRMYFLCLANNYSTGTGTGGNEYNLLPRGCRLSKQQGSKFCIHSHMEWCMHDWGHTRQCLKPGGTSPAIEPILLLLAGVPSPISSPCHALGKDWITKQRYLWLNKGWHSQVRIRWQNVTL